MALTVCTYCEEYFSESRSHCEHCGKPQMPVVQHALLIHQRLRRLKVLRILLRPAFELWYWTIGEITFLKKFYGGEQ